MASTVRIVIPTPLRQYVGNQDVVEIAASDVRGAIGSLVGRYDQLRRHLYNDEGRLRNFVNIYVNEEDIRFLQGPATPLKAGDAVSIVPAIAGGTNRTG